MPGISRPKLVALARTFPSLAHAPHLEPFDPEAFAEWNAAGRSHGERLAGDFVLHVFNWYANDFKLGEAMNVWDSAHIAAFAAWARSPWYA